MADGGRNAAWGLRYQYLRTLEALMDAVEEPALGVTAVHVEGLPGPDGASAESIDYELSDASGRALSAVQVKARAPGTVMGAGQLFGVLVGLTRDKDATRYELLTSATAGDSAVKMVSTLGARLPFPQLREVLDTILAAVSAAKQRHLLAQLSDEHLTRLGRASVSFDPRGDAEISENLRARLRRFRSESRAGLGDESAGLMIGYLISEIFRRAGTITETTVLISQFRSLLLVDGVVLAATLGKRDWGAVVGSLPPAPDVRRPEILARISAALPLGSASGVIPECRLTGMSGIGKTSLAVGYLLDRADIYDVIFWADAEREETLASSFLQIFRYLRGDRALMPADLLAVRDAVLTDMSRLAGRWLLILDNCTDEQAASSWMPRAGPGHVLLTTINSARPPRAGTRIEMTGMPVAEGVELLTRRLASDGQPDGPQLRQLVQLARELEGWPLALELASAYLFGSGLGIEGIPEYLHRMKLRSLGDLQSVPPGYPRTLIQAIDLCLESIGREASVAESPTAWIAVTALVMLRIAAYMSSRQIPVYLLMSVPEFDVAEFGFRDSRQRVVADDPDHPPAEVVRLLRAYSLVASDERLPPESADADSRRYDYTIAVNSVLQEVIRARFDGEQTTGLIVDRLAWHAERWMTSAYEAGAHDRALVLTSHVSAVEDHAARLSCISDSIAYLRGNLASIQLRQHKTGEVIRLLRTELHHFQGRQEEHAQLLTCHASIQLASVLADDMDAPADEIADLLEAAYLIVLDFIFSAAESMAYLVSMILAILAHIELVGIQHDRLAMLTTAARDLADRLPATAYSKAARTLDQIKTCLNEHTDVKHAASLARSLLDSEIMADGTQHARQIEAIARKFLIEALAADFDMTGATAELSKFTLFAQPPLIFVREIEDLVHNVGYAASLQTLAGVPGAAELLAALLADGRPELIESSFAGETVTRISLVRGVHAFHHGDLTTARKYAQEFTEKQVQWNEQTTQRTGWRKLAQILSTAINSQ